MDYKKKYEEALERAKKYYNRELYAECNGSLVEDIFPELKESEDEKIRKALIHYFSEQDGILTAINGSVSVGDILAWLEKQGEKIDVIENFDTEFEKQVSHLIASTINKEHKYNEGFVKWAANALLNYAKHELEKQDEHKCDCKYVGCHMNNVKRWCHKKQSEILYEKCNIKCSEYLKQGEQKTDDKVLKFKVGDTIVEKDPDECDYETIKDIKDGRYIFTDGYCMNIDDQEGWKLVKTPTIIEQKTAWSEEDERNLEGIINEIEANKNNASDYDLATYDRFLSWLKSLKDRVQPQLKQDWKPSDEQMEALLKLEEMHVLEHEKNQENAHLYMVIKSLKEQLFKLKEE